MGRLPGVGLASRRGGRKRLVALLPPGKCQSTAAQAADERPEEGCTAIYASLAEGLRG